MISRYSVTVPAAGELRQVRATGVLLVVESATTDALMYVGQPGGDGLPVEQTARYGTREPFSTVWIEGGPESAGTNLRFFVAPDWCYRAIVPQPKGDTGPSFLYEWTAEGDSLKAQGGPDFPMAGSGFSYQDAFGKRELFRPASNGTAISGLFTFPDIQDKSAEGLVVLMAGRSFATSGARSAFVLRTEGGDGIIRRCSSLGWSQNNATVFGINASGQTDSGLVTERVPNNSVIVTAQSTLGGRAISAQNGVVETDNAGLVYNGSTNIRTVTGLQWLTGSSSTFDADSTFYFARIFESDANADDLGDLVAATRAEFDT